MRDDDRGHGRARELDLGQRRLRAMTIIFSTTISVKVTGLAKKLGQLDAVNKDLQSKYWAKLQLLGQP